MKSQLSSFSIIVSFVCLILTGLALTPLLPVKLSPSKELNDISISFSMAGQSPRIVESEVTSQIEAMLSRIDGVKDVRSTSGNGWGRVNIGIDKYADVDAVRFEVSTIIRQLWPQLPKGVSYPGISSGHSSGEADRPFLIYTLNAPSEPNLIFRYAEETLKPHLAQIAGINRIDVSGAMPMEWQLEYDYGQMRKLGISLTDLQKAISQSLESGFLGMGNLTAGGKEQNYCTLALSPEAGKRFDPAVIAVKRVNGKLIFLNQLVKVSHREEAPQSYFRINGLNSIYISVYADEQANQLGLGQKIKDALAGIQHKLPGGYELHKSYDATEYIREELHKIVVRTGLTILILLLFVLLISRSIKYLTLIVLSLLANLAVAVIFYYLLRLEMQLYSLAGITISLGLVIDNVIVMTDHLLHRKNKKVFVAILAATLTTIAALTVIFFLEDKVRLNLQDFALVVIVNLAVSLVISLFLVPALVDKLGLDRVTNRQKRRRFTLWKRFPRLSTAGRRIICFNKGYIASLHFIHRFRVVAYILIVLTFGLPVFMLPEKWDGNKAWHKIYNKTFGTEFYNQTLREYVNMALGGTLRLFSEKVYDGGSFSDREETSLYVTASMPNGATLKQMNETVRQMEAYITSFRGIRQFQTSIYGARRADISITFTKEAERNGLPYSLKSQLIAKALTLGDASWSVSGLGDGFSNDLKESAGSYRVSIMGYNYDELMAQAETLKHRLLTHQRIKEVLINSEFSWYRDDYQEFTFDSNPEKLAQMNLKTSDLYSTIRPLLAQNVSATSISAPGGTMENIRLCSRQSQEYDIWSMNDVPHDISGHTIKVSDLASVKKEQTPQQVQKENQQYKLCLQYEYIGAYEQGSEVLKEEIDSFSKKLPMGYSVKNENDRMDWGSSKDNNYKLLFLIVVMIFFICSILFNSMLRPLAVIMTIPISFIGIFIMYYVLQIKFDQGGLAAFVLLSGLTVNSAIYILNDYDSLCREKGRRGLRIYLKSFNGKIIPILLTILSTVLGFVPFLIGSDRDQFWYSLAVGTIGGLIFSLFAIVVYLPVMIGVGKYSSVVSLEK